MLVAIVVVALVVASDYFVDYPSFLSLPEVWECPGRSNGFQFCK